MIDPTTGIHEPMVILPMGMDCRELKFRAEGLSLGSVVMCSQAEMRATDWQHMRIDELLNTSNKR